MACTPNQDVANKVKDGTMATDVYDSGHGKYKVVRPVLKQPAAPMGPTPVKGGK